MAHKINLQEAQTKLLELLQVAIAGEDVIIIKDKQPLVYLIPHKKTFKRTIGTAQGEVIRDFIRIKLPAFKVASQY